MSPVFEELSLFVEEDIKIGWVKIAQSTSQDKKLRLFNRPERIELYTSQVANSV